MTWREYQLRRNGYIRAETEEWKRSRLVAYNALVATGAVDPRKMSIEKFMPLSGKSTPKMTDEQKAALKKRQLELKNGS